MHVQLYYKFLTLVNFYTTTMCYQDDECISCVKDKMTLAESLLGVFPVSLIFILLPHQSQEKPPLLVSLSQTKKHEQCCPMIPKFHLFPAVRSHS